MLKGNIEIHCDDNPFATLSPLRNIVSSMIIPANVHPEILERDEKGQHEYKKMSKIGCYTDHRCRYGTALENIFNVDAKHCCQRWRPGY